MDYWFPFNTWSDWNVGMHSDYHRASDSVEKIDFEKLARISRLMFHVGLGIANADQRPQRNAESYRRLVQSR